MFGEHQADATGCLDNCGNQGADAKQAVPRDQVRVIGKVLAGYHEAQPRKSRYQNQSLTEPVETDFELSRLAAEGRDFSREEEDPFGHTEAVLRRRR